LGLVGLAASLLLAGGLLFGFCSARDVGKGAVASSGTSTAGPIYRTKNIEDLQVGDRVLAWDEATGRQALKPIDRTYRRVADHLRILTIRSSDGQTQTLRTTDEHPFWVPGKGWKKAGELAIGERLLAVDGRSTFVSSSLFEPHPEGVPVFNLRIEDSHTYYAAEKGSAEPILVHNANYPFGSAALGQFMHEHKFAPFFKELFPEIKKMDWKLLPGQTGVDATVLDKNFKLFKYAELKPDTASGISTFNNQIDKWGINDVALFLYDAKGNMWLETIYK